MALAPIDLQTLFTQVDKVGKAQAAQKEGQALQQAMQGVQLQKKTDEQLQQINETQNTGEGVDKVNDRSSRQNNEKKNKEKQTGDFEEDMEEQPLAAVLRDPALGNKIDISY